MNSEDILKKIINDVKIKGENKIYETFLLQELYNCISERICERGKFDDEFTLPASSTVTRQYTLGRSDFEIGFLVLYAVSPMTSSRRRILFECCFTTVDNDAVSKATEIETYSIYGYLIDTWRLKGYDREVDNYLGEAEWYQLSNRRSRPKDVRINGSNLEIDWENTGGYSGKVAYRGVYHIFK